MKLDIWRIAAALLLAAPSVFAQNPATPAANSATVLGPTVFHYGQLAVTKNATGEVRSVVKQPTATVDELEMHITTLNPGQTSHPAHKHVNEELILIDSGECETLSNGKWIKATKGDIIFNASNSLHQIRNVGTTPAQYHVINWSPNKK
ncbi:cupin domain-containing protein [Terriglobus tenax]|uniref:cupin domain-containing protein n=1 Tax=Terriglobus tenax TaxID=1111115 RepID=UPI0021DFB9D3|nr:cupin domain-containing protein [Terriglobus tenax]